MSAPPDAVPASSDAAAAALEGPRRVRSGSEKRQRAGLLSVRLSPDERAQLDAAASAAGLSRGSFIRWQLTQGQAPRSVRRPPAELEELRQLLGQLGKIGSNLNQVAHKLNAGTTVYPGEIERALADLRDMRDAVVGALGGGER